MFGASLGNLVRGVPLGPDGLSNMPLFTEFLPGRHPGILDAYTALVGSSRPSLWPDTARPILAWRTTGPVHDRSLAYARKAWRLILPFWIAVTLFTAAVQHEVFTNLIARPWSVLFVILSLGRLRPRPFFPRQGRELPAFLASSAFLLGLLASDHDRQLPYWLRSTIDPSFGLSARNTASAGYGLRVALTWWLVGIALVVGYFFNMFRSIRGKVLEAHGVEQSIDSLSRSSPHETENQG